MIECALGTFSTQKRKIFLSTASQIGGLVRYNRQKTQNGKPSSQRAKTQGRKDVRRMME